MNSKTCNFVCLFHLLISSTSIMDYILVCIGQFVAVTSSEFTIDICCQKLFDVPQDINNSITSLDLKWNRIRQIMENAFDDLYLLEFLNLDFNKVSYISPKAFRNNHVLHHIKLYDHRLMAIPEQFGEAADSLMRLEMKGRSKHILQSVNFTDYPLLEWVSFTKSAPANGVITLKKSTIPEVMVWWTLCLNILPQFLGGTTSGEGKPAHRVFPVDTSRISGWLDQVETPASSQWAAKPSAWYEEHGLTVVT